LKKWFWLGLTGLEKIGGLATSLIQELFYVNLNFYPLSHFSSMVLMQA